MLERTGETPPIEVRFYGLVRDVVGESHLEMRLPEESTVADLLDALADRYGERFWRRVMDDQERLSRFVEIIVNGRQVDRDALDTPLAGADQRETPVISVLVLPPSAGG